MNESERTPFGKEQMKLNYSPDTSLLLCLGAEEPRVDPQPHNEVPAFDEAWNCNLMPNNFPLARDDGIGGFVSFSPQEAVQSGILVNPGFGMPFVPNFVAPVGLDECMPLIPVNYAMGGFAAALAPQRFSAEVCPNIYVNKAGTKLSEAEDWTPNPARLLEILVDLEKLNEVICRLKDECELPNAKPNLKRERNRLASKACRLKKKATHETNKIKLEGLEVEFKLLVYALHFMSWEVVSHVNMPHQPLDNLSARLKDIQSKYLSGIKVAGDSDNFVKHVLDRTKTHDHRQFVVNEPIIQV